jgi:hypothetical protein
MGSDRKDGYEHLLAKGWTPNQAQLAMLALLPFNDNEQAATTTFAQEARALSNQFRALSPWNADPLLMSDRALAVIGAIRRAALQSNEPYYSTCYDRFLSVAHEVPRSESTLPSIESSPRTEPFVSKPPPISELGACLPTKEKPLIYMGSGNAKIAVFTDRFLLQKKWHWITEDTRADVTMSGGQSVTQRLTLTRAVLIGPFSIFAPKKERHVTEKTFLTITSSEGEEVTDFAGSIMEPGLRKIAAAINTQAKKGGARNKQNALSSVTPPPKITDSNGVKTQRTNRYAIASVLVSFFGLTTIIGSIIGFMLGMKARRQIAASNGAEGGEIAALVGIALGCIGPIFMVIVFSST